jgi:hypothetical protein
VLKQGSLSPETDFSCLSVNIDQCKPIISLNPHVTYGYMMQNYSLTTLNLSTTQKDYRCVVRVNTNTSGNKRGDDAEVKCSM